jgi:hypothetical protein
VKGLRTPNTAVAILKSIRNEHLLITGLNVMRIISRFAEGYINLDV